MAHKWPAPQQVDSSRQKLQNLKNRIFFSKYRKAIHVQKSLKKKHKIQERKRIVGRCNLPNYLLFTSTCTVSEYPKFNLLNSFSNTNSHHTPPEIVQCSCYPILNNRIIVAAPFLCLYTHTFTNTSFSNHVLFI